MTFYDSLGNSHQMQLYFRKTAANAWGVYSQIDGGDGDRANQYDV
jgi:flagellar hook protein FlgE